MGGEEVVGGSCFEVWRCRGVARKRWVGRCFFRRQSGASCAVVGGGWSGDPRALLFSRAGGRSGAPAAAALSCASPCAWRVVVGFRRLFRRAVVRHCLPASLPTVPLRAVFGAGSSRAAPPCRRSQRSVFVRSICFCKCILFFVWLLVDFCFCSRCYCFLCALMVTVVGACAAGSSCSTLCWFFVSWRGPLSVGGGV